MTCRCCASPLTLPLTDDEQHYGACQSCVDHARSFARPDPLGSRDDLREDDVLAALAEIEPGWFTRVAVAVEEKGEVAA